MDNRRSFMVWLGSFLGLGAVAGTAHAITTVPQKKLEGFIVFFVNVGQLPPFKAEAFIQRIKDGWKKSDADNSQRNLIANWEPIWIPTRTQETHAEFYPVNGKLDAEGRLQQIEGFFFEYEDQALHVGAEVNLDDPELKKRTLDYALFMLGAPVIKINLEQQLDCAYDNVIDHIKNTGNAVNSIYLTEQFVKDGTLGFVKMFFGRIHIHGDGCIEDSDNALALYEEGRDEVKGWTDRLKEMM